MSQSQSQPHPPTLDHSANVYLAITHNPSHALSGPLPVHLASREVALEHVGQVGALKDVQLYEMPRVEWDALGEEGRKEVMGKIKGMEGVTAVEEQVLRQRVKRDEL
ncbi:hypothetical protein DACRYDRAFT_20953 [Dacryopinax primogenitus]|uniref:Uncharacterized protein n=1 Tax=Dacryopinax primogenitus (strain DJM 731) TaxID=1858805 RepID=M5GFT5_DACPD|nr:uncharacterized protein DACRYDRAFT_20953 [Dacryopinax primogenitus]EJU04413.1 hypothetical protein DACRYDRAFT_20953 [Dacryopinax primogenitus]